MEFSVAVLFTGVLLLFANLIWRSLQENWLGLSEPQKRHAFLSVILLTFLFNCTSILIDITRSSYNIRLHAFIGDCLTAKQNIPDLHATCGFCCETLHQFLCETFTVIAWLITCDLWLLLRNYAPVIVWNFYGDCLTDYLRLLRVA